MINFQSEIYPAELRALLSANGDTIQNKDRSAATLKNWLNHNELSRSHVTMVLQKADELHLNKTRKVFFTTHLRYSPDFIWVACSLALKKAFPSLSNIIEQVASAAPKCLEFHPSKHPKPFTYDLGHNCMPFVSVQYRYSVFDALAIAHEFGHAIQIATNNISGCSSMPPVAREVCAFLAELAFLKFGQLDRQADILRGHQQEDHGYLVHSAGRLRKALVNQNALYEYDWNYSLARYVAAKMFKPENKALIEELFQSGDSGGSLVAMFIEREIMTKERPSQHTDVTTPKKSSNNYLPEVPEKRSEPQAVEAYRVIGMMTYLDLDYWRGHSDMTIEEYYGRLLKHMQTQTLYVAIGDEKKPIGYATWNVDSDRPDHVVFTRQAAPFGDHLILQKCLQRHLPHAISADSINERSARVEQTAW